MSDFKVGYITDNLGSVEDINQIKDIFGQYQQFSLIELDTEEASFSQSAKNLDFLMTFQDKTVLTLASLDMQLPPIFVVEVPGYHSFFSQISLQNLPQIFSLLENRQYRIRENILLKTIIDNNRRLGLNDIYVISAHPNTRIRYEVEVDNEPIFENPDSANGILISTPTGSTAMAMNLGGSVIHHSAEIFQFQAVASRNYLVRRRIFSSKSVLKLHIYDANLPLLIQIDNRRFETDQQEFDIELAENTLNFLDLNIDQSQSLDHKLTQKLTLEDTADLTSSAKFILHVLKKEDKALKINEIMDITHLTNQKTVRNSLKLLIEKGFVRKVDNLEDMREHLYIYIDPALTKFYNQV